MKEILLIARNPVQCSEWLRYLKEKILKMTMCDVYRISATDILMDNYHIIIRPMSEKYYQGRHPAYHYVYGLEANSYLLSVGSNRLRSLDDVIDIVKKGEDK